MKSTTLVILIAFSVGIFMYYINPQYKQILVLQAKQDQYDEALGAADELQVLRNDLFDKYNSFSTADLRRLKKFLPEQIDEVRLILDVNSVAKENNLELLNIHISSQNDGKSSSDSRNSRTSEQSNADLVGVNTLNLRFSLESTYAEFIDFITDLESSLRVIDITELNFVASRENPNIYEFSINLQTYWLK